MLGAWCAVLGAIQLSGVTGSELRARAFFDAYNVKVGDPLVLTVDFIGAADFHDLHPPALARAVNRRDWKVDDLSAKTDTFRDARRLTYRVRPIREGVLWFPALEFSYSSPDGTECRVRANSIPVHATGGEQVVVAELGEDQNALPTPPELVREVRSVTLTDDQSFAWRKALAKPTAEAFASFDWPEARMNEATCALRVGNWSRAQKIYQRLEWSIGQTPELERGLVAALALRHENPAAELPVWRQVLRPVLRFGGWARAGIVLGGLAALSLLFWILGRGIRALACLALIVAFAAPVSAQGLFERFFHFGEKEERQAPRITASLATDKAELQVGDGFAFIVSVELPKEVSAEQVRLTPSSSFGLTFTGPVANLTDRQSSNPSNVIKRLSVPVRYDVPFKGRIAFAIEGMATVRETRRRNSFFTYSTSFRCDTPSRVIEVKPLPAAGQPADFSGIISEGLRVHEYCDRLTVASNDVVVISYKLVPNGYVPADFLPKDAAFEWVRQADGENRVREIEYRRFLVADGIPKTPVLEISYYDPRTKTYRTARTGGTSLKYGIIHP